MTDTEKAMKHFEKLQKRYTTQHNGKHCDLVATALFALRSQSEREKGCEVCNGDLPCDNDCDGFCDICEIPEVWKTIHKTGHYNFCPMCGRELNTRATSGESEGK